MKHLKLSPKKLLLFLLLAVTALSGLWYLCFYAPIRKDTARLWEQAVTLDSQLVEAASTISRMKAMEQAMADEGPNSSNTSQVAPFDNKQQVLSALHEILENTLEYNLTFADPEFYAEGLVRRTVIMDFRCRNFSDSRIIIRTLSEGPWLCLIRNLSVSGSGNIMDGTVDVRATLIYLENTKLH